MASPFTPEMLSHHDDAGPTLIIVSWTLTALATVFLGLRIFCKTIGHRVLYYDDWVLIAAWVVLVADVALATYMVKHFGYGKHTWDLPPTLNFDDFSLIANLRATFAVVAAAWTKTAFAITLLRLTDGWTKRFIWFVVITVNIALGMSGLLFWVQCTPVQKSWTPSIPGKCMKGSILIDYAIFGGAYSAAMDFVLAMLPWKVIWALQMKKVEKVGVAVAMSMGVFAGITAVVKSVNLPKLTNPDLRQATDLVIWDITESSVTMIAACIPVLRILLREVRASTGYYATDDQTSSGTKMSRLQSRNKTVRTVTSQNTFETKHSSTGGGSNSEVGFDFNKSTYIDSP